MWGFFFILSFFFYIWYVVEERSDISDGGHQSGVSTVSTAALLNCTYDNSNLITEVHSRTWLWIRFSFFCFAL